jgi:hypothetical protein
VITAVIAVIRDRAASELLGDGAVGTTLMVNGGRIVSGDTGATVALDASAAGISALAVARLRSV